MIGFYQWIDALWLPVVILAAHKQHRLIAPFPVLSGMLMLRLQVELMNSIHYPRGFLGLMAMPLFERGLVVYSVFYLLYAALAHYSPGSSRAVFLAASITTVFAALFVSSVVMVL